MTRVAGAFLLLALLAAPLDVEAQPAGKMYRLDLLGTYSPTSAGAADLWDALLQGLRDAGYVEGRNLVVERRHLPEAQAEGLEGLAAELVRLKVDVIVAGGSLTPHAAKRATTTIPIVIPNHGDPVGGGLVASLARPGGNITGLSILQTELVGKQLELVREMVPGAVRVAVLWNPNSRIHPRMLPEAEAAAQTFAGAGFDQPTSAAALPPRSR